MCVCVSVCVCAIESSETYLCLQFLANMSHEIRTPLHAIISMVSVIRQISDISPKIREYVDTIYVSANALMALLNDILGMDYLSEERWYLYW